MAMNTTVIIHDKDHEFNYNSMRLYFIDAAIWAVQHCKSYKSFKIREIGETKQMANYLFEDERDALLFRLKWS